jgi:hypothetical protein
MIRTKNMGVFVSMSIRKLTMRMDNKKYIM